MTRYILEIKMIKAGHTFFVTTIDLDHDINYYCASPDYKIVGVSILEDW